MKRLVRLTPIALLALAIWMRFYCWSEPASVGADVESVDAYRLWIQHHGQIVLAAQPNNPPFLMATDAEPQAGFDQDLARSLALALGADIRLAPMLPEEAREALAMGEIDGILGPCVSEYEAADAYTQTLPYLENRQALFVPVHRTDIEAIRDLVQQRVAVVGGSTAYEAIISEHSVTPVVVSAVGDALDRLISGQVEAVAGDERAGLFVLQQRGAQSEFRILSTPVANQVYAIAVHKENRELLRILNYGLSLIEKNGEKEQITEKWFGSTLPAQESPQRDALALTLRLLALAALAGIIFYWARSSHKTVRSLKDKIRESERRRRILTESSNDAIFSVSPSDTSILEVNRRAEQLTGYGRESLLRMRLSDVLVEETGESTLHRMHQVLMSGSGLFDDMALLRRDGARMDIDMSASVIDLDHRKVIQIAVRDITERKGMERELTRRNRNLSALNAVSATVGRPLELDSILESALDNVLAVVGGDMGAIYLYDETTGSLVLRVFRGRPPILVMRSQSLTEKGGTPVIAATNENSADLAGVWWPEMSQPDLGSFVSAQLRAKDRPLGVMNVASGRQRWFTSEDVDLLTAVANQISVAIENAVLFGELRRTIGDLFVVKQFNENALQSMTNGLITLDLSGRINSVNLAAARMIGYAKEDLLRRPLRQVLSSSNGLESILSETIQKGVPCSNRETVLTHKDGFEIPIGLNTSPLRDKEGVITGLLLVFDDLSEVKRVAEEKHRLDQMVALGQMSQIMAHELRNPVASISAGIQQLGREITNESQQLSIQLIMEASERVNRLVQDVLMVSRPTTLDLTPAQVAECVDSTLVWWQARAAEKRVRISKNYAPGLNPCLVDPIRLDQAISNLISNALDAMPDGGDLRISVRQVRRPSDASPPVHTPSDDSAIKPVEARDWVRVEIADTGVGIPADALPRIFEPFFTTKKANGTGLGLTIAERIIKDHGGELSVRSQLGVGTVFSVDLPLAN